MPPWLNDPESVAAFVAALLGLLATIGVAIVGACGAVMMAWQSKIKPLLTGTQAAAQHAAEQLTPNHGSTVRDAVRRTEAAVGRLDLNTNQRIGDLHALMGRHIDQNDRAHSEIFKRLHQIESPPEETRS